MVIFFFTFNTATTAAARVYAVGDLLFFSTLKRNVENCDAHTLREVNIIITRF